MFWQPVKVELVSRGEALGAPLAITKAEVLSAASLAALATLRAEMASLRSHATDPKADVVAWLAAVACCKT